MAEHFVGPVMEKLIDACFEYLNDQVRWQTAMKEELQSLRENHPKIKAVVSVYNHVEIEDSNLNNWLWQLRDAIDEADDVLDELEYWKLEKQVNRNKKRSKVRSLMKSIKRRFVKICKRALKIDPTLKRLEVVVHKLDSISAEVSTFLHLLDLANQKQQQQQLKLHRKLEAGAMPGNELLGRSKEMNFVRLWLRNPYQTENTGTGLYKNISLLSVVGHGGMGKTTLLQHVFQDGVTDEFDVKMLVCVSNNFDAKTVIKNMLESLKKEKIDLDSLGALQINLQTEVTSKKFLLVLDDIWEEDDGKWETVLAPLQYGSFGSKILITTRLDSVATKFAKMIKKRKEMLQLKGLEEDECLKFFNTHAFAGVENPDDEFRSIAAKMVEKLSGCPLAAKVIGGILNSYVDKNYWTKVLNTNIGKVGSVHNHLLPILKLSYIYLPKFLKNCFSFCCMFPRDYEFDKNDLIRMWIALGFIKASNIEEEVPEDTGRRYFNILVQNSFFDECLNYEDKICYRMHELLHELAQIVSTEECFRLVDDRVLSIPKTIRYLSIDISSSLKVAFKMIGDFKNLRSLFLSFSEVTEFDENVISEIFKASKSIRLLVISYPRLQKIPDTIGCLIHLRYLKVESVLNFKLPRSISHLYHLQFIISESLPDLEMDNIGWKELMPNEKCQLIMDEFVIKNSSVLLLEPLKSICSFHFLRIEESDELVSFPTETEQWFLQRQSSLFELKFDKLQFLESLPYSLGRLSSLKTLRVYDVPQLKLLPNPPASLVKLELCNLESLQCLPSSLSTISFLTNLKLKNIPLLKSLPDLPSSLSYLHLEELENLDCLPSCFPTLSRLDIIKVPLLLKLTDLPASLHTLSINGVSRLLELPDLPSSLEKFKLKKLESLQWLPSSLSTISSLTNLKLKNIPLLKSIPDLPSSLEKFKLKKLESLQWLPSSLSALSSLTNLILKNIPLLKSLPDLPPSLRVLDLEELENLDCLPSCLPTLGRLRVIKVPRILELPDLPSSLTELEHDKQKSLQCLPPSIVLPVHDRVSLIWDNLFDESDGIGRAGDDLKTVAAEWETPDDDVFMSMGISHDSSSEATDMSISQNGRLIKKQIRSWMRGILLGSGSFGPVYEGISEDGLFIAVKEMLLHDKKKFAHEFILELEQEIALLSQFEHENIVEYYGTDKDDTKFYIFLELVTQGSIVSLYQKYHLRDTQVSSYTRQILNGLNYLHERDWVHGDIKGSNILIHANGSIKLADFGIARVISKYNDLKFCRGSVYWMAPEVINLKKTNGYGSAADIWSLGCTVLEMLTRQYPYQNMEWPQAMYKISRGVQPSIPDHLSLDAKDFIIKCVQIDPSSRPTAAELLEHAFVTRKPLQP